ncbi:hypothetical protein HWV62_15263 [Athelia sp. TMB]|nr:hypothetical protein HWV62_15263 [Athelia sp. TMB]
MTTNTPRSRPAIRALLIDLSGTLHIGSSPTPRAVAALQRLRSSRHIPFRFCSNTSKESTRDVISRLKSIGFDIHDHSSSGGKGKEVWTSVGAVGEVLAKKRLKRPFFLLSDSAREECASVLPVPPSDASYDSVVVGLAPSSLHYNNLTTAFRILVGEHETSPSSSGQRSKPNIPLIATHKAKYIQSSSGLSLGPGPFVQALENAAGVTAEIVGKPTRAFFQAVIDDLGFEDTPEEEGKIVIVGDDIQSDLGGGALELGLWRVLGKTSYFILYLQG